MVVAALDMGRYQAFGNLFATVDGVGYRLDRHPTMARHPVTPMGEADLRLHLARQTERRIGLVDFVAMKRGEADAALARELAGRRRGGGARRAGRGDAGRGRAAVWEHRGERLFAIGSQGLQQALVAHWRAAGLLEAPTTAFRAAAVDRIACVSGSVSPVTAGQIAHAERAGFAAIPLDAARAVDEAAWGRELGRTYRAGAGGAGRGPGSRSSSRPGARTTRRSRRCARRSRRAGAGAEAVNDRIGAGLGLVLGRVVREAGLRRAVIAGGDTSGHAALRLGVYALTAIAPLAPGAPLCRAHADDPALDRAGAGAQGRPGRPAGLLPGREGRQRGRDLMRLAGKHALVTGAGRGIGLAIANALAREGAAVAIADLDGGRAEVGRGLGRGTGAGDPGRRGRPRLRRGDGRDGAGGVRPARHPGQQRRHRRQHAVPRDLARRVAANLGRQPDRRLPGGPGGGARDGQGRRRPDRQHRLALGPAGGHGRAAYGSAKAGLELLTKAMAVELAPHGINVNAIAPGPIETEIARFMHDDATRAAYHYLVPMSRYGTPEEIADAAVFLCSEESRYMQGHTLNVDGGFLAAGLMYGAGKKPPER